MVGQPCREQVARIDGEVQERREVTEELDRQALRLVDDPHHEQLFAFDELGNALLELLPEYITDLILKRSPQIGKIRHLWFL